MTASDIGHALGGAQREGRNWRCQCPLHGGHSLILRDGNGGRVLATCWGGCDRREVLSELRRLGLLDSRADYRAPAVSLSRRNDDASRIASARRIWDAACDADGTPVVRYLAGRGLTIPPPTSLRWASRCPHPSGGRLPAMIGLVEHCDRGIVGIHRTYLRADGAGKTEIEPAKASLGSVGGGAVQLGTPRVGEWLAIAEGIETALAVASACSTPAWAALSAGGLERLVLPSEATHVVICADHDVSGTGHRAARNAAQRWLA